MKWSPRKPAEVATVPDSNCARTLRPGSSQCDAGSIAKLGPLPAPLEARERASFLALRAVLTMSHKPACAPNAARMALFGNNESYWPFPGWPRLRQRWLFPLLKLRASGALRMRGSLGYARTDAHPAGDEDKRGRGAINLRGESS